MITRRNLLCTSGALLATTLAGCAAATAPLEGPGAVNDVVALPAGKIRGSVHNGIRVFRNVPFGANPYTPERRFRHSVPPEPWTGVRDCTKPGAIPLQPDRNGPGMIGGGDALVLNLWAPADGKNLPVMVWIPGGGSTNCDNNDPRFDGTRFAEDGVVLVTLNYRVNVDGFLKLEDGDANCGLSDMILGLKWVHDNIALFGGDPDRVTVFGQSAGGTHTTSLIASPKTKGLFSQAIIQSPSAVAQWRNEADARKAAKRLADFLGVPPTRAGFASLTNDELVAFKKLVGQLSKDPDWSLFAQGNTALFKPYVEHDILQDRPVDAIRAGAATGIRVISGCTKEEWRNYVVPNGAIDRIGYDAVKMLTASLGLPSSIAEDYRAAGHGRTTGEVFTRMQGDLIFRMPCNRLLESLAISSTPVWAYSFEWESPVTGKTGQKRGAAHSSDVSFVFDTIAAPTAVVINGADAPQALADAMHGAWVRFAKTGDPGWEPFDLERRATRRFADEVSTVLDPWAFERKTLIVP